MSASKTASSPRGATGVKTGRRAPNGKSKSGKSRPNGAPKKDLTGKKHSGDDTPGSSRSKGRSKNRSTDQSNRRGERRPFLKFLFGRWAPSDAEPAEGRNADRSVYGASADGIANGVTSPAERLLIDNILRLRELRVADAMTPRADIAAIPEKTSLDDAMAAFKRSGHSRLPVFRETLDDPAGFVHLKDLAVTYGVGREKNGAKFSLTRHLHKALFVPPSMGIVALLQRMQGEQVHMALVIDEFGGVDGLVTIEDLVEQIVGEIEDEHDNSDPMWRADAPGVWTIEARAEIEEFEKATGLHLRPEDCDEDTDTLGGLVFTLSGKVPSRGEVITHPLGHEFQVLDADPRRIKLLRLTLNEASETAE